MTATMEMAPTYLSNFARLEQRLGKNGDPWFHGVRKKAIKRFAELGFPTTKLEEWKFTNVTPLARIPFQSAEFRADGLSAERLEELPLAHSAFDQCCCRILFVNGHYNPQLSSAEPRGHLIASSLASAIKRSTPGVKEHLARHARFERQAFVALNTAFLEDGAFIEVPRGVTIEEPIYLLFVSTADGQVASHPRSLIIVGDNSQASIIEDYLSLGQGVYFTNAVTEIVAGDNSVVDHYKLQC